MRIDHLTLTNFKNFSHLDIDFSPGVNLFVGGNGSGKTGLLEAINVALGGFFGSQEQKMQRPIEFSEIRMTHKNLEPFATVYAESSLVGQPWSRTMKRDTGANDVTNIKPALEYGAAYFKLIEIHDDKSPTPIIAYYSTQRLFRDAAVSKKQQYYASLGRRNGYLQCLRENSIKPVLNEWLAKAATRRATKQIKEIETFDFVLENVEEAIRLTLIDFLDLPADFPLKIYQDPDYDNELFLYFDEEHDLPLAYYSDGFRNMVYLIIDLIWRASQLNPWMDLPQISEQVNGVVTIDEIDLHLHPKWQAKAISILQRLLPRVQFFITTHSPTVVANFENGSLYIIDRDNVNKINDKYFGKEINTVLRDVLGAYDRHKPTQDKIDLLLRSIGDKHPEDEIQPLLTELINLLGEDDPDVQSALSLIAWNKIEAADAVHQ